MCYVVMEMTTKPDLPDTFRAFKTTLKRDKEQDWAYWAGVTPTGAHIRLWQEENGSYMANMSISRVTVQPDMTSSSPAAALRNLRGHLHKLAYELKRVGIKQ